MKHLIPALHIMMFSHLGMCEDCRQQFDTSSGYGREKKMMLCKIKSTNILQLQNVRKYRKSDKLKKKNGGVGYKYQTNTVAGEQCDEHSHF